MTETKEDFTRGMMSKSTTLLYPYTLNIHPNKRKMKYD